MPTKVWERASGPGVRASLASGGVTTTHSHSEPLMEENLKVGVVKRIQGLTAGASFNRGDGGVQTNSEIW